MRFLTAIAAKEQRVLRMAGLAIVLIAITVVVMIAVERHKNDVAAEAERARIAAAQAAALAHFASLASFAVRVETAFERFSAAKKEFDKLSSQASEVGHIAWLGDTSRLLEAGRSCEASLLFEAARYHRPLIIPRGVRAS